METICAYTPKVSLLAIEFSLEKNFIYQLFKITAMSNKSVYSTDFNAVRDRERFDLDESLRV